MLNGCSKQKWEECNKNNGYIPNNNSERLQRISRTNANDSSNRAEAGKPKILNVANCNPSGHGMNGSVYFCEGLAPTLTTNKGEGIKVITVEKVKGI